MTIPHYIDLDEARSVLSEMGIVLTRGQMQRAAELDARGRRKLPFFIDPIKGTLKIERGSLIKVYRTVQVEAENNLSR